MIVVMQPKASQQQISKVVAEGVKKIVVLI
jgi:hypothetical protein